MTGVGAARVPRTPKQPGRKAAKKKTAASSEVTLSPADKLAFLRDYLVRTRFDVMQDKETLTKLFYAKIVLFGALSLMLVSKIGIFAVLFFPVVLFLIDFYHKKRFLEIFARWDVLANHVVPQLRKLPGFWSANEFQMVETIVWGKKKHLTKEEALVRWLAPSIASIAVIPLFAIILIDTFRFPAEHSHVYFAIWAAVLVAFIMVLFCFRGEFARTYPLSSWIVPIAIVLAAGGLGYVEATNDQYVTKLYRALLSDLHRAKADDVGSSSVNAEEPPGP
jgi:hypothetical protein